MSDAAPPPLYRLLAAFSGVPLKTVPALEAAGLRERGERGEITEHHRALLRQLAQSGRIRWVLWGPDGDGYVLTGDGEISMDAYFQRYGPAHVPRRAPPLIETARAEWERQRREESEPGQAGEPGPA